MAFAAGSNRSAKPFLERVNGFIAKGSDFLMPWLFAALGLAPVADSALYFYRGTGLFQF